MLRPQARLAAVLNGRERPLACEELTLRARLDLDHGREREAALQVLVALDAALAELAADPQAAGPRAIGWPSCAAGATRSPTRPRRRSPVRCRPSNREAVAFTLGADRGRAAGPRGRERLERPSACSNGRQLVDDVAAASGPRRGGQTASGPG